MTDKDNSSREELRDLYSRISSSNKTINYLERQNQQLREQLREEGRDDEGLQLDTPESFKVLTSGIAHEFNNLLAIIIGNADYATFTGKPGI